MKIFPSFFSTLVFISFSVLTFAGNKAEVIIPGDHTPKYFKMASNVKEGDYLPNTIIFKVKPQYRQNCKVNSVDNLLPLQDLLQAIGAQRVAKIYPRHKAPEQERNRLGKRMVDLSLIYFFSYSENIKLEEAINKILSLGYFEYVEPWYVPKILFTPNDPSLSSQYHLQGTGVYGTGSINAPNAWGINKGSSSVVIGITDTGTELNHPDLVANYFHWVADPIDGIDNDGDGYIDNYNGWDLGMNDNDPTWANIGAVPNHGVITSGDADAVSNNSTGVASPGFNCKHFMVKCYDATGVMSAAYQGIVYAADHGATIISNSWGGSGGSSYGQNIIDYAAINKNCLVMASAGNSGLEEYLYPSSYNNVYRVSATTSTDALAGFSDYGVDVDWCAPGNSIYSTTSGGGYGASSGTSMSCPVSAGAAGIVQSQFNYTYAFQIGERLKQTCTPMTSNAQYNAGKLGKGRIDMYNALTQAAKSIMVNPITVVDGNDNIFMPGETLTLSGIFTNYLDPCSSAATATFSVVSGPGSVMNGNFNIGALPTLGTVNNNSAPFTLVVNAGATINSVIKCKIHIADGVFSSDTYFDVLVNVDYINITINDVFTTITSKGRIGYNLDMQAQGLGFQYQLASPAADLLFEMSLMIGTSSTQVSDMFRGVSTGDNDFGSLTRVHQITPAVVSDFDVSGKFNDAPSSSAPLPVEVRDSVYAWSTAPYRKFVIVKYSIKNTGASTLSNLYAGIAADWDVPNEKAWQNKGSYDAVYKMGYTYLVGGNLVGAIKLLSSTAPANNYFIDNVAGGNGAMDINTSSGFTTAKKYTALSTSRNNDGFGASGGDVIDCVSSGPFTINAGDSIEVAFALIGGDDLPDIQTSACAAQEKYDNGCANPGVNVIENDNFWMFSFPNPATGSLNINYNIVGYDDASIQIINSLGETVRAFNNLAKGKNVLALDVSKLSNGNYFYQLRAGEAVLTKKLTIIR
ncbi:MAG: S8 family serine peptidase [Bacteroidetes bacterium]|nr:S8 family serine peptidase [Bacteroidota bacterium]